METILKHLIGKKFITEHGDVSPVIIDVKMVHIIEPDTPGNDWWGNEYDELTIIFDGPLNGYDTFTNPMPVKNCVNFKVI